MADTRVQLEVEDWVRKNWMPHFFGMKFSRERLTLRSGGVFDFDAVSTDEAIAATISTSSSKTASGRHGVGKLMKIRSDMLFLLMAPTERKIVVLTERDMYDRCLKEREGGRVPPEIEFLCAEIPEELRLKLNDAKGESSREVSPQ